MGRRGESDSKRELNEIHATSFPRTYEDHANGFLQGRQSAVGAAADCRRLSGAARFRGSIQSTSRHLGSARAQDVDEPFYVAKPGSIRFTLWWSDADTRPDPEPANDALRVKVHAGAHRDYVTLSFYLDAVKQWSGSPQTMASAPNGKRRQDILTNTDRVRKICEARMVADAQGRREVDREILPENGVSASEAAALLEASRYLYSGVWGEFCRAMGIDEMPVLETCRVFANFRGVVMATDGLPETVEKRQYPGSSGAEPFPRFKGNGGIDHTGTRSSTEPNEANAVVKASWPFVRRSTPDADRKEFVVCSVMSWRALYVTALNCPTSFEWREEARTADTEIPAGHLPGAAKSGASDAELAEPIHYLLITKGDPHRRQIGRIAERINAMGTMRLIALRDYNIIRDASTQIQLRGQELDGMMRKWSTGRAAIRRKYTELTNEKSDDEKSRLKDLEDAEIQELADAVEAELIDLSAALDKVGKKAVHGLHFRINRSRYYVCEFESLLGSLKIGNIDTWVSYDQFVTRGLKPAFDFIDGVGVRLLGLRDRLQSVLEGIETSALVRQTSATRDNTAQLKAIARAFTKLRRIGIAVALVGVLVSLFGYRGALLPLFNWLSGR